MLSSQTRVRRACQRADLRRRSFLALAVAAPGLAAGTARTPGESVTAALHRWLGNSRSLREFGRLFRARQVDADAQLVARLGSLDAHALGPRIKALRQEDFAAGRVVVIDGWVLARTEAEACAFIAGR